MRVFMLIVLLAVASLHAGSPEDQILILDQFVTAGQAQELIAFYKSQKKDLSRETDNQLTFSGSTPGAILELITQIAGGAREVMEHTYGEAGLQVDHVAMYARIKGNSCSYHADNCRFECPVHGKDQSVLRQKCKGTCAGARFYPNHTEWRAYTALLYLNEDFEGGEIAFEDGPCNRLYKKVIPMRAQRLVITPNSPYFYHEVYPITKGTRYSLHLWYTKDSRHFHPLIRI